VNAARWFNLVVGVILLSALTGFTWSVAHGWWRHAPSGLAALTFALSSFVLVLAAIVVGINFVAIADWIRVRVPPVVHDDVVGQVTYRDGYWRGEKLLALDGRRTGPDPELLRAGAQAVRDADALEARARAFALASGMAAANIGELNGIRPVSTPNGIVVAFEFSLADTRDVLDVVFRDGEPVAVDIH
jgi:hypothetical protein